MGKNLTRNNAIICFLVFLIAFTSIMPVGTSVAMAVEESGSNVLGDLSKASEFNMGNYPSNSTDYSISLIQIAESTDNELLLYVYQPSGDIGNITASTVSMSTGTDSEIDPRFYSLELLNSEGVFYKYKVKDFVVPSDDVRVYSIVSILRPFISGIDEQAGFDNTVSEVPFTVAKEYTFYSGQDGYQMQVLDVVTVTDKFVGYVYYPGGYHPYITSSTALHNHVVAFSTDKQIDDLLEAEIYYVSQSYHKEKKTSLTVPNTYWEETFGETVENYVMFSSEDKLEYKGSGWFAGTYVRDRIQTVDEFIASENIYETVYSGAVLNVSVGSVLTEQSLSALSGKEWVVRFADTDFYYSSQASGLYEDYMYTLVGDVSILRLKFVTDGETYNLGVVDNKQTGSDNPMNDIYYDVQITLGNKETWQKVLAILALLLLLLILIPVLPYIIRFLVWIIKKPIKAVSKASKKAKKKRQEKRKEKEKGD